MSFKMDLSDVSSRIGPGGCISGRNHTSDAEFLSLHSIRRDTAFNGRIPKAV